MEKLVLVTGGSGLIGKTIQGIITNEKYKWIFLSSSDGNLEHYDETENIFKLYRPNIVIHLAANVGGLFKNLNNNSNMFFSNMRINMNIIELCSKYEVEKLINCLSTCVFPDNIELPMTETDLHKGPPHESNRGYSYAKRMIEVMTDISSKPNIQYINIIPTNVYGPYDNFDLDNSHVIPAIIHKMYLAKINNLSLKLKGTGKARRQFIYSEDLARLIINLLTINIKKLDNKIDKKLDEKLDEKLNIILAPNSEEEISIKKISKIIANYFEYKEDVIFDDTNPLMDGQIRKTASNDKLRELFPNFEFTPLNVGIEKTVIWFSKNYPNIRK